MKIGDREIGPGQPCFIVAELSGNHMGELGHAMELVAAAHEAGADAVKFQLYELEEMVALRGDGPAPEPWASQGRKSLRHIWEAAVTPPLWLAPLRNYCGALGLGWFSSVFGRRSLAWLEGFGCPAYKIASADCGQAALLRAVRGTGKPVLVSRPYFRHDGYGIHGKPWWGAYLYCPPGYPAPVEAVKLERFSAWNVGLSSHCPAPELPVAAVARGAKVLEYHLMLPDTHPLDEAFSLTPDRFAAMVRAVRRTEAMLG